MEKILTAAAFASLVTAATLAAAPAGASVIYKFHTTDVTLGAPDQGNWDGLTLTLTLFEGLPAAFDGGGCTFGSVGTLTSATSSGGTGSGVDCLREDGELGSNELLDFSLQANGPLLTGEIFFDGFEDAYTMTSNADGSVWTGLYNSDFADACYGVSCAFAGVWTLVSGPGDAGGPTSVPEPAPLALIGLGLATLGLTARKTGP